MDTLRLLYALLALMCVPSTDCVPLIHSDTQQHTTDIRNQSETSQTGSDVSMAPFYEQFPNNGTLVTVHGESSMRVFDHGDIVHPEFDPTSFLNLAASDQSMQPVRLSFRTGDPYFLFVPPNIIKEAHKQTEGPREIRRHRVKRHHPNILQNVLGELQNYALVPVKSQSGKTQYILLKNPKFVIGGTVIGGQPGAPLPKIIQLPEEPQPAPFNRASSQGSPRIVSAIDGVGIEGGTIENLPGSTYRPGLFPNRGPVDLGQEYGPSQDFAQPVWPRIREVPLYSDPFTPPTPSALMAPVNRHAHMSHSGVVSSMGTSNSGSINSGTSLLGSRGGSSSRGMNTGTSLSGLRDDSMISGTSLSRGGSSSGSMISGTSLPGSRGGSISGSMISGTSMTRGGSSSGNMLSGTSLSRGGSSRGSMVSRTSLSGSMGAGSSGGMQAGTSLSGIRGDSSASSSSSRSDSSIGSRVATTRTSGSVVPISSGSSVSETGLPGPGIPADGHTVHQTEVVETVVQTQNKAAAVASQTNATNTAAHTAVSSSNGDAKGSKTATQVDTASSVAASSAAASQAETTVTKKTTKTSVVKDGTGAVHHVHEVVEEQAVKKDATAVATDTAAAVASSSSAVSAGSTQDGAIASAASSSSAASSASSSATATNATSVKKITKKTTITKTKKSPETLASVADVAYTVPGPEVAARKSGPVAGSNLADNTIIIPLDTSPTGILPTKVPSNTLLQPTNQVPANIDVTGAAPPVSGKKKAKTAILSDNNDKPRSIGTKSAFIVTPRPRAAARIKAPSTAPSPTSEMPATEEIELEDMTTTPAMTTMFSIHRDRFRGFSQQPPGTSGRSREKHVAGWSPATTEPPLGPNDRVNTTDVPEEIEPMPDKTPAELRAMGMAPRKDTRTPAPVRTGGQKNTKQRQSAQERFNKRRQAGGGTTKRPPARNKLSSQRRGRNGRRRQGNKGRRNNGGGRQGTTEASEERLLRRLQPRDPFVRWFMNNVETSEILPDGFPLWALLGKK